MKKITTIATLYLFYVAQITPLFADDIEIYQGGDTGIRPNVMFVLDTSSEMAKKVTIEGSFYDHTQTYPGPFRNDRLYYYNWPENSENGIDFDWKAKRDDLLNNTVHPDAFKCETHSEVLEKKGFANGKFMQWQANQLFSTKTWGTIGWTDRNGIWKKIKSSENQGDYIDCQADAYPHGQPVSLPPHGLNANDGFPYMTNNKNGQPYSDSSSDFIPNSLKAWREV